MEQESEKIKLFFVDHLNRLYCAKAHLVERLEELADDHKFDNLRPAIADTLKRSEKQIAMLDQIFEILHMHYSFENCASLVAFMEDSFAVFRKNVNEPYLFYVLIISYLQSVASLQLDTCKLLQLLSEKLGESKITALLQKVCSDTDRTLQDQITALLK